MRFLGVFLIWCLWPYLGMSQTRYEIKNGPFTKVGENDISNAFLGGLNSPQFVEIDLNQDKVMDLLVFDRSDFSIMPFLRVQKSRLVYAPEYLKVLPAAKNFLITADLNSDGYADIFTSTETGDLIIHLNEYPKNNSLSFRSLGEGYYRNQYDEGFPILYNPLSLSNAVTDLPGILDMDGDGDIDIVNYDQFNLTYMMYKDVRAEKEWEADTFEFQNMDYCFGYFWEGFDSEIKLNNCPINLSFPLKLKPRHVGGASCWFYDEDHDGDMEMYMANLDFKRITRLVNAKSDAGHSYDTMVLVDTAFLDGKAFDGFMFPAGYMIDVDQDGLKDMVVAPNLAAEGKQSNQVYYYKNHGDSSFADFKLEQTNFIIEKMLDHGAHSQPLLIDLDNDGDLDLLVGHNGDFEQTAGIADRVSHYENTGNYKEPVFQWRSNDFLNLSSKGISKISLSKGDVDNDGREDILYGTLKGELYFLRQVDNTWELPQRLLSNYTRKIGESSWAPAVIDYNQDGINDLLIGFYNGNVGLFEGVSKTNLEFEWKSSHAFGIKSNAWLENLSEPDFASYGYARPSVSDIDNDGNLEVLVGGHEGVLRVYHIEDHDYSDSLSAQENLTFKTHKGDTFDFYLGGGLSPTLGDITGDSIPDLIIGGVRGGLQFGMSNQSSKNSINKEVLSKNDLFVYPNPINMGRLLHVKNLNIQDAGKIEIYDNQGQLVITKHINKGEPQINIPMESDLFPGLYHIRVINKVLHNSMSTHFILTQ